MAYDWEFEPTDDGTRITETWSTNRLGLLALAGILMMTLLMSGFAAPILTTDLWSVLTWRTRTPSGGVNVVNWPMFMIAGLTFAIASVSTVGLYRLLHLPWTLEDLDTLATAEYVESIVFGSLALHSVVFLPTFLATVLAFVDSSMLFNDSISWRCSEGRSCWRVRPPVSVWWRITGINWSASRSATGS